ncbi:MAG: DNA polymerase III subunit chi [Pseudomonadota bacterium]
MTKISFYQTQSEDLAKTFCKISEKCYYNNLNTLVITGNEDYSNSLDKSLWTYSKKHFIPHATINDSRPSDQSILITTKPENLNSAEIIIFVNPNKQIILESISENSQILFDQITKIIFVFDETNLVQATEIKNIFDTSKIHSSETNYFIKTPKGAWQETPAS